MRSSRNLASWIARLARISALGCLLFAVERRLNACGPPPHPSGPAPAPCGGGPPGCSGPAAASGGGAPAPGTSAGGSSETTSGGGLGGGQSTSGAGSGMATGSGCSKCTASPSFVQSGNLMDYQVDLSVRTAVGTSLAATRAYDSGLPIDGLLGVGWISGLATRVTYSTYLFAAPSTYRNRATVLLPDGLRLLFSQNTDGTFSPPVGRYDTLTKNGDGTFDLVIQRSRSSYHYAVDGRVLTFTDDNGNVLSFTYDGNSRLTQVADSSGSGRFLNLFYGANGRISTIQDSAGRQVNYAYDSNGLLTSVTDPAGRTTTYTYSATPTASLLSQVKDTAGRVVTSVTYDSLSRVWKLAENGRNFTYTYAAGQPNRTFKGDDFLPYGSGWGYIYNGIGQVTDRQAEVGGPVTHTDYWPDGSIQQTVDEVGVKTYYTYDSTGRVTSVTRDKDGPLALRFDYSYDPSFPAKVVSVNPMNPATNQLNTDWQAWRYDYYQAGSSAPGSLFHAYRVQSDGTTTDLMATYQYDSRGRVTRVTSPTGGVTDYAYDALGNLQTVTSSSNNDAGARPVTTYGYDSLGRVTSITDASSHTTTYTYDPLGRMTSVTLPKPSTGSTLNFLTTYSYDNFDSASGLTFTNVTDPNGRLTKQGYDQWGRLVQSVDAVGNVSAYTYTNGYLTSIRDPNGNVTTYTYNYINGWLTSKTLPDGGTERYAYNLDGTLNALGWDVYSIVYSYDGLKRVTRKWYSSGAWDNFTYVGQEVTQVMQDFGGIPPTETHTVTYDSSYRVSMAVQAGRGTLNYLYNPDDTVASMTVQSGPTATYAYYADGSLNTIQWSPVAGSFKYSYTLPGQYHGITFPNGQTRNFSYDDQGRLSQLSSLASGGANIATYVYAYDLNYTTGQYTMLGQRVSMTATVPSQGLSNHQTKYEYDPLYQLIKATYPNVAPFNGEVDSWTYDGIGNRLTNTVNGSTSNYTYQKITGNNNNWQRLTNDGANAYAYGTNGNTLSRNGPGGNFAFGYDPANRMVSISGATTASYLYDYQGRRSTKTVGSATSYLYDGENLIREGGASSADYLFGPGIDEPLAMIRGGQVYYYETDALGSVNAVTNSSASVQNTYLYDAWGQVKSQTGSLANPFTYTSREGGEAGLNFYRARYYQPSVGRFLSEDPLLTALRENVGTLGLSLSLYVYTGNRPVDRRDPLGLKDCGPPPALTGERCAGDCHAKWGYLLCKVRESNDGADKAVGVPGIKKPEWCDLEEAPFEALISIAGQMNVGEIAQGYRNCLNHCQEKKCLDAPFGGRWPPLCRRGYPFFKNPVLPLGM
jgi:RHS repeat-associated protein